MDGFQSAGSVLAIDHDRLFKELLTTFFVEFLELFFPKLAASIDRDSIEFLSQEHFVNFLEGHEYHADMAGYYYPIHHGDGSHRKNSKIIYDRHYNENQNNSNNNSYDNVALLLCYPPPDNEMGYDAIRNYHRYRPSNPNPTSQPLLRPCPSRR